MILFSSFSLVKHLKNYYINFSPKKPLKYMLIGKNNNIQNRGNFRIKKDQRK